MGKTTTPVVASSKCEKMIKKLAAFALIFAICTSFAIPLEGPGKIYDFPSYNYTIEKPPNVAIKVGDYLCDNYYHGAILPCLLRPELPPYSYSTEFFYNMEYKKK